MIGTQEHEEGIRREFAARRRRQIVLAVPLIGAILMVGLTRDASRQDLFGVRQDVWEPALLVGVIGALVFSFRNWRCPACDRYLGRQLRPRSCSGCGVALQDR